MKTQRIALSAPICTLLRRTPLALAGLAVLSLSGAGRAQSVTDLCLLRSIDTSPDSPADAQLSPDGQYLYVSARGPDGNGQGGSLLVVDTATEGVVGRFDVNAGSSSNHGFTSDLAVAPAGDRVYMAVSKGGTVITAGTTRVEVLDVTTPTAPARLTTFQGSPPNPLGDTNLALDPSGSTLYVTSRGNGVVRVVDTGSGAETLVAVSGDPIGVEVTPDGSEAWVASRGTAVVTVITTSNLATQFIGTSLTPPTSSMFVRLSTDGSRAYATSSSDDRIAVIDTATRTEQTLLATSASSVLREGVASPDGRFLFVNAGADDETLVIDVDQASPTFHTEVHAIGVGSGPFKAPAYQSFLPGVAMYVPSVSGSNIGVVGAVSSTSYCTAGTSANGCQATLSTVGFASATSGSGFTVSATGVEGSKDGILFFGDTGRQANPWGNGTSFQCVAPPVKRTGLLSGSGSNGQCDGSFSLDLNALWCPTCPRPAKNPGAGALVQAQVWYRDPVNTSNQTTSMSDAIEFCLGP